MDEETNARRRELTVGGGIIDDDSLLEDNDDGDDNEEENGVFYDNFKMQATQFAEDNKASRERKPDINHSKLTEQLIKIIRKGVTPDNTETDNQDCLQCADAECRANFRISRLDPANLGDLDDEGWRKVTATLECQTKLFGLRTDTLQLNLDQMLQGIEKEAKPQKSEFTLT